MVSPNSSSDSSAVWTVDGNFEVAYSEDGNREPVIDNIRWKFVAAVAIFAMVVSLLSGGLGGIRFGVLIMRALIGGVVFAALAVGLNLLVTRIFPEILETDGPGNFEPDADRETPGSRVDIVMPSESPGISGNSDDRDENPALEGAGSDSGSESAEKEENEDLEFVENDSEKETDTTGDLDHFSGDFSEVDDEDSSSKRSASDGPGGDHDPEELAQAIQTVIKRDEKG